MKNKHFKSQAQWLRNKKSVNLANIFRLTQIFNSKKWPIDNPTFEEHPSLFENFCRLLAMLSQSEQELILTLTEDFLRCTYFDYPKLMLEALKKIDSSIIDNSAMIFLLPLVPKKEYEKGESKSGHFLPYITKNEVIPHHPHLKNKDIKALADVPILQRNYQNRKNSLILFLDDFVGTGETAIKTLCDYCQFYKVACDTTMVVSLVIQEKGIEAIQEYGFDVVASNIRSRGISDSQTLPNIQMALSIMDEIESRLQIDEKFLRGYGQSEALVKMIRTPNNTFPVYWCTEKKDKTSWPAPFMR